MFLKAYRQKSSTALKGSESKKLRQRLQQAFSHIPIEQLIPAKANVTQLKLLTHGGSQTTVFCVDKQPMFFELEEQPESATSGQLVPTLYTIWSTPNILPFFTTFEGVLPKLSNGADLMLPGVVPMGTGLSMYGHYKKGQLVAVNLTNNSSAVGVGQLARSSDELYMCGGHGVAVKMLHMFGDKLWGHEPSLTQQIPTVKTKSQLTPDNFPALGTTDHPKKMQKALPVAATAEIEAEMTKAAIVEPLVPSEETHISSEQRECADNTPSTSTNDETPEGSPETTLKNAFLAALKNNGKKLPLPLLTSNFYRLYVVPEAGEQLDLKKTRYKKLSNFLAEMVDQGFLVVREESKGVDKITSVDLEHPEVVNFITDVKPNEANNGTASETPLFHSELKELYVVTDATAAFFTKMNYKRGEGIPVGQIKKIVREYVSKHGLLNSQTKLVKLDDTLQELCECQEGTLVTITSIVTSKMEHSFQMCSGKDTSGKPLIQMSLATRSGNKKVTLVSNIEAYGIILSEFIKLCKQGAAASTTIVKLPHQKHEQLQVQGNQVRFIYTLLTETYKVPPKCILGLELAKDGKKNKRK
ncbi:eukaryotic translation initiation factor 2D [Scaptodrosophila lebanonensis]|uniref:Eukaryotic translation initiation factor 2D n=1 Tax=Drosophila lebanonensis TaxID=7225 RepID=A0A6J2SZ90_DROLE|nr:eukaryotic translation initiation factor 2D [Scaptodrosophila lebanonensis]